MGAFISKSLGISGSLPAPENGVRIGALRFRIERSAHVNVFYPAKKEEIGEFEIKWPKYRAMRDGAVRALAAWGGTPAFLMSNLKFINHPYVLNAPICAEPPLPVVIFSHGLAGNCELYTKFCSDLAASGHIVLAVEHGDGTASYAEDEESGEKIPYRGPPNGMPYTREKVAEFRKPFLEFRKQEIKEILNFIRQPREHGFQGLLGTKEEVVLEIFDAAQTDKIWLSGHSFGGASTFVVGQDEELHEYFQGLILLDLWPFPVPFEVTEKGFRKPTISILSEQFHDNDEVYVTEAVIRNSPHDVPVHSFFIPETRHQQFSDIAFAVSKKVARRVQAIGKQDHQAAQRSIVQAVLGFMQDPDNTTNWIENTVETTPMRPTRFQRSNTETTVGAT